MSIYEGGSRPLPMGRNRGTPLPEQATVPLDAPGVVPLPFVPSETMRLAAQLSDAVGATGGLVNTLGDINQQALAKQRQDAYDAERQANKLKEAQDVIDAQSRGRGSLQAASDMPILADQIGKRATITGDVPAEVKRIQAERTAGMDAEAQRHYIATTTDDLTRFVVGRNEAIQAQAVQAQTVDILNQTATANTVAGVRAIAADVVKADPSKNLNEVTTVAFTRALQSAAATNSVETIDKLKDDAIAAGVNPLAIAELRDSAEKRIGDVAREQFAALREAGAGADTLNKFLDDNKVIPARDRVTLREAIKAGEAHRLSVEQNNNANNTLRDTRLGRYGDPNTALIDLKRRMDLPADNPYHLNASLGTSLVDAIETAAKQDVRDVEFDRRFTDIANGRSVMSADANSDVAIMKNLSMRGAINADVQGQQVVMNRITSPVAAAMFMSGLSRVPVQIQRHVAAGLASMDPEQVQAAATQYAALALRNPALAASIEMPPEARIRASFIENRLTPYKADLLDDASIETMVAAIAPETLSVNPKINEIDATTIKSMVFSSDLNDKAFKSKVYINATNDLSSFLKSPKVAQALGVVTDNVIFGNTPVVIPDYVNDTYQRNVVEEFRYARSFISDDAKAAEVAKERALFRTITRDYPVMTWNNKVSFLNPGEPVVNADVLRLDAERSLDVETADRLWSNYTPRFDQDAGGWVFYETGRVDSKFIRPDGKVLILSGDPVQLEPDLARNVAAAKAFNRNEPITGTRSLQADSAYRYRPKE